MNNWYYLLGISLTLKIIYYFEEITKISKAMNARSEYKDQDKLAVDSEIDMSINRCEEINNKQGHDFKTIWVKCSWIYTFN